MDPDQQNMAARDKLLDYAGRMLYMIQRRTIRDLIIRARSKCTGTARRAAYDELIQHDGDCEKHFKDITAASESTHDVPVRFLAAVKFENGFETMRWLSIGNRIKWMKICAMIWHLKGRKINEFRFNKEDRKTGLALDRHLGKLEESLLNKYLIQIDGSISLDSLPHFSISNQHISAFGIMYCKPKDKSFFSISFK
jgi:hypothetical protein